MNETAPRRWRSFSLRTLLIVVTLLCCWLGWESSVVRERRAVRAHYQAKSVIQFVTAAEYLQRYTPATKAVIESAVSVPLARRWMGDEAIQEVWYGGQLTEDDMALLKRVFPETELHEIPPEPCHPGCFPAGTLIDTASGPRCIETIKQGDTVTSILPNGQSVETEVQTVFVTDNRLWKVTTSAGELITTETQPLCLSANRLTAAGELDPGDHVLFRRHGAVESVTVLRVARTDRLDKVYNLILGKSEVFVAGGFLARSKPPRHSPVAVSHPADGL
ncbi:MAG: Hint domain-containing protein [Pirellulales bacterium]